MAPLLYSLSVDLDVYKALTARLESDGQTHNDVLRDLLNLDSLTEPEAVNPYGAVTDLLGKALHAGQYFSRGLALPNGTELRARYKGREYRAQIIGEHWVSADGEQHESPSAAAGHITGNNVNGLRFWEAKRPGDAGWRRLDSIRDHATR